MATSCRICGKPVDAPYRVYTSDGRVREGCVSPDHDDHLVTPSESARWHARPEARDIRRRLKRAGVVAS